MTQRNIGSVATLVQQWHRSSSDESRLYWSTVEANTAGGGGIAKEIQDHEEYTNGPSRKHPTAKTRHWQIHAYWNHSAQQQYIL